MSLDNTLAVLKRFIPKRLFHALQPGYHFVLAYLGALVYRHPSRELLVIAVTGTKGKSSTLEYLNAILEADGRTTALVSTIRTKVGQTSERNLFKMSTRGRFFLNRTLRRAVRAGCDVALLELTSEAAKQYRHRFLDLDALVFTNLAPEHIESHGSFENYAAAKLEIARQLARSRKRPRFVVANADDEWGAQFLRTKAEHKLAFSMADMEPYTTGDRGGSFRFQGEDMRVHLPGLFSIQNAGMAALLCDRLGVPLAAIRQGLDAVSTIPGRAESIDCGQPFFVVVDYAHTLESLQAIYDAYGTRRRICVMGSTGGGRDKWKRPQLGALAEVNCAHVILTDEDPYDESPERIVADIAAGMKTRPEIILDRRAAIRRGIELAAPGDAVLITGKGTDPYIMGPNGTKQQWSDAEVAREEIEARLREQQTRPQLG